jgi:hypothetical protein
MGTKKGQGRKTARKAYKKRKSAEPMMDLTGKYRSNEYFEKIWKNITIKIKK